MEANWRDQLVEARRCLTPTGQVLIWTAASGKDAADFSNIVESIGFKTVLRSHTTNGFTLGRSAHSHSEERMADLFGQTS